MIEQDFKILMLQAFQEDFRDTGDITSQAIFSQEQGEAAIIAKSSGVISGIHWVNKIFSHCNPTLRILPGKKDGDYYEYGDIIVSLQGPVSSILQGERTALNFLGYLSGIATATHRYQSLLSSLGNTVLLDTRKTLPGYRLLAKEAVVHGGGKNHRIGLYDMVMIKDNHIDAAGGLSEAVQRVRKKHGTNYKIEVECRTLEDVQQALNLSVDMIMLDNMDVQTCSQALAMRKTMGTTIPFEASGDMDEAKIREYGSLGLDYISSGRITHSVVACNFSLKYGSTT